VAIEVEEISLSEADYAKCPEKVIVEPSNLRIHDSGSYISYLNENEIKLTGFTVFSLRVSEWIGTRQIGVWILGVIVASAIIGAATGCHSWFPWLRVGCQDAFLRETRTSVGDKAANEAIWPRDSLPPKAPAEIINDGEGGAHRPVSSTTQLGGTEVTEVQREQLDTAFFNLPYFQASIILFAFILAFSRWMIENRQSSMSELFERKKEVNLLLLKDEKSIFQPLVSEAVRAEASPEREQRVEIANAHVRLLLHRAKTWQQDPALVDGESASPFVGGIRRLLREVLFEGPQKREGGAANADFLRKMFVYIELDNFELAFNRYIAGLLDPEQMFRACEIIESRCMNSTFRYLAANQGLKYYTANFHKALIPVLVRTEYLTRGAAAVQPPADSADQP
jgi:hypothetical protein